MRKSPLLPMPPASTRTNTHFRATTMQQATALPATHFKTILQTMTTTTTIAIAPDSNTSRTMSTCTRTLNSPSTYILTSVLTMSKSSHQLITIHVCSIETSLEEQKTQSPVKHRHFIKKLLCIITIHKDYTYMYC